MFFKEEERGYPFFLLVYNQPEDALNTSHSLPSYSHKTPVLIFGSGLANNLMKKGGLSNVREFYKSHPWEKLREALKLARNAVVILPRASFEKSDMLRRAITQTDEEFPQCSILVLRAGGTEDSSMVENDKKAGARAVLWHPTENFNEDVFRRMATFVTTGTLPERTPVPPAASKTDGVVSTVVTAAPQAEAPTAPSLATTPTPSVIPIEREVYIPLLKEIIQQSLNGVFTSGFAKDLIYKAFPKKSRHGLLMGTIWKLVRWGLVRQVAPVDGRAAWQVEEAFLLGQGMDLKLDPLPIFATPPVPPVKKQGAKASMKKATLKKPAKKKVVTAVKSKQLPAKKPMSQKPAAPALATKKGPKATTSQVTPPLTSDEVMEGMRSFLESRVKRLQLESKLREIDQAIERLMAPLSREALLKLLIEKLSKQ